MPDDKKAPVFIIGAPRSGTTLLRVILDSHSKMALPHECKIIQYIISNYPKEQAIKACELQPFFEKLSTVSRFDEVFRQAMPDAIDYLESLDVIYPKDIVNILFLLASGVDINDNDDVSWGDKNIGYSWELDRLRDYFPSARFIHIVRDVHDCAHSVSTRLGKFFVCNDDSSFYIRDVFGAALLWKSELKVVEEFSNLQPENIIHRIRYEDLVTNPESVCRSICNFLNVEYEEKMLEDRRPGTIPQDSLLKFHENAALKPSADKIGKGRNSLAIRDINAIQKLCYSQLVEYDYPTGSSFKGKFWDPMLVNFRYYLFYFGYKFKLRLIHIYNAVLSVFARGKMNVT